MTYNRRDIAVQVGINTIKGYTMKEIGALEDRIRKLEYYTVLNALALDTKTTSVQNSDGIERFKNGVFADPFNDDTIMNTQSPELNIAISSSQSTARPNYFEKFIGFELDSTDSTNVKISGRLLTLDYNNVLFGSNPHATTIRNCAETFYSFKGALQLYPSFDNTNVNTQAASQTIVNDQAKPFSDAAASGAFKDIDTTYSNPTIVKKSGSTNYWQSNTTITIRDIKVESQKLPPQDLGDFVKDVTLMPYMVGRQLAVIATHLKPNTRVYPFFDKKSVSQYCAPAVLSPDLYTGGQVDTAKFNALAYSADPKDILQQKGALGDPLVSDDKGNLNIIFNLPSNTFRSGERVFMVIDQNDVTATSAILTSAEGMYTSSSLSTTKQKLQYQVIEPKFTPDTHKENGDPLTWTTTDPPPVIINNYTGTGVHDTGCCFDPDANVVMFDGSKKKIFEVQIGDKVMSGLNNTVYNNVVGIESPAVGDRLMYSFNDNWAFVSEEHPIMTENGWGAFNPDSWAVEDNFKDKLVKIDKGTKVLKLEGGYEEIVSIDTVKKSEDYKIYNLMLDGDNTFVVEGYVVHNKASDNTTGVSVNSSPCAGPPDL